MHITREYQWDMGHRLQYHQSLCRNLHGHRYVAQVTVEGPITVGTDSDAGMVLDFALLDDFIRQHIGGWDHAFMLQDGDPLLTDLMAYTKRTGERFRLVVLPVPPTAENIATEIATRLNEQLSVIAHRHIARVRVYETPRSSAEWSA